MEKKTVCEAMVNVNLSNIGEFKVNQGYVSFKLQSTGGGANIGRRLMVYDHRPITLAAALVRVQAKQELLQTINQPARISVMERIDDEGMFQYVNLFQPLNNAKPAALFCQTSYVGKHNAGFEVKENNALWFWISESSSRTGRHKEMDFVCLTDIDHAVVINSYGFANIGHSDKDWTVIDEQIFHLSGEEMEADEWRLVQEEEDADARISMAEQRLGEPRLRVVLQVYHLFLHAFTPDGHLSKAESFIRNFQQEMEAVVPIAASLDFVRECVRRSFRIGAVIPDEQKRRLVTEEMIDRIAVILVEKGFVIPEK